MAIANNTLSQNVWTDVKAELVAASLETTNPSTSSTTSANITGSYNDKSGAKPQVVISPILMTESDFKFGGTAGKKFINVVIDIYSNKPIYIDQLADQVKAALADNDISGIDLVNVAEDYAFSSPGEQKYHLKSLTFTYVRE